MNGHKIDVSGASTRVLLARRARLAARFPDVAQVLSGSLTQQTRRCGKPDCRCADGPPHGPYTYLAARSAGRVRLRYVPAALVAAVRAAVARGERVDAVLAEISAINTELLSRRELS